VLLKISIYKNYNYIVFNEIKKKKKGRDGLCDTPEHFHNAAIYSQKGYMFINPAFHGYFVSLLCKLLYVYLYI